MAIVSLSEGNPQKWSNRTTRQSSENILVTMSEIYVQRYAKGQLCPPWIIIPISRRGSDHGSSPIPEVYPDNLSINRPWSWSSYPPHLVGKFPSLLGVLASSNLVFDYVRLLSDCFLLHYRTPNSEMNLHESPNHTQRNTHMGLSENRVYSQL